MSSRGVLISNDSVDSFYEFPIEASSPPPKSPRSPNPPRSPIPPRSPHGLRADYFDRSHRGNSASNIDNNE